MHGVWSGQTVLGLAFAMIAAAQPGELDTSPLKGYFAHLATPQLPGVRLFELTVGESRFDGTARPSILLQEQDLPIHLRLILTGTAGDHVGIRIRVSGATGLAEQTYWIPTRGWEIGGAYGWSGIFRVPALTLAGQGMLSIGQLLPGATDTIRLGDGKNIPVDEAILFQGPVFTTPVTIASRLRDETVDAAFGADVKRLGRAFRLGPNTSIRIGVDLPEGERCVGVGIISSLGGSYDFGQGDTVVLITPGSSQESLHVRAGVDTSFADAAAPPPGVVRIDPVRAIASPAAPYVNWHDAPMGAAVYASSLRFSAPHDLRAITIRYVAADGYIDVHDLVCLVRKSTPTPR